MVTAIYLGIVNNDLSMVVLDKPDSPKKDNSANTRFRVVYELGNELDTDVEGVVYFKNAGAKEKNVTLSPMQGGMQQSNYSVVDHFGEYE